MMKCTTCGSENITKIEDEKFVFKTYQCDRGHKFELTSSGAKAVAAGGALATLGAFLIAVLTGGKK